MGGKRDGEKEGKKETVGKWGRRNRKRKGKGKEKRKEQENGKEKRKGKGTGRWKEDSFKKLNARTHV